MSPPQALVRILAAAATVVLAGTVAAPVARADSPTEVLSVTVTPSDGSVDDGFLTLQVDLELRDADGLPETLHGDYREDELLGATRVDGDDWLVFLPWTAPQRVSGTRAHGMWRATAEVSGAHAGTYRITGLTSYDEAGHFTSTDISDGPEFSIRASEIWDITPTSIPARITSHADEWVPRARVTVRGTGRPTAAGIGMTHLVIVPPPLARASTPGEGIRAGQEWVGSPRPVLDDPWAVLAYRKRSRSAWSLEAFRFMCPTIKYQASGVPVATSVRRGDAITVTGKVWPAPSVYTNRETRPHLYLQHETSPGVWTRVATAFVRPSGRYTLSWEPQSSGRHSVRVWVPGSVSRCGTNAGTVVAPASVVVR